MNIKLQKICSRMAREGLDGLFLNSSANISYLTGFRSRDASLLVSSEKAVYFTDSRYLQEARGKLKGLVVKDSGQSLLGSLGAVCRGLKLKKIGFEENLVSYALYHKLKSALSGKVELTPVSGWVEQLRAIKTPDEIKKIRKAAEIAIGAMRYIRPFIAPGVKEIEVAGELERYIRYHGADAPAFDIIVASGVNSSLPHHYTCQKAISSGELVLIDLGVDYQGYKSDLTRVFLSDKIYTSVKKVYDIVLAAQRLAFEKARPGTRISEVDFAARDYISRKGFGKFFHHSLGHGVGLEIHESPRISAKVDERIAPGMVFTIEPAVYLPGKFGVRLEDMIITTNNKCEVISGALDK